VSADGHPVWYLDDSISSFGGTVDFGGGPLAGHGGWDVIVVELGQEGEHHWSHVFGGDMSEQAGGLGVDNNGNLSLTGMTHSKSISFGGASLPGQSTMDAFVALLGKDGSHIWSQRLETNGIHLPLSIAVGDDGGIVVGAIFNVSSPFQIGDTVFSGGGSHLFKISVTGAHEWQKLLSNMTVTYPLTIVMSPTASIFVGGEFQESGPDFGNGPISFVGGIDGYVAAFGH
jgi:hypothetical protein